MSEEYSGWAICRFDGVKVDREAGIAGESNPTDDETEELERQWSGLLAIIHVQLPMAA